MFAPKLYLLLMILTALAATMVWSLTIDQLCHKYCVSMEQADGGAWNESYLKCDCYSS